MEATSTTPPELPRPKIKLPPGACDCHHHLFGPLDLYPQRAEGSEFQKNNPSGIKFIDEWQAMQGALGLSRGLLVQSSRHGNSYEQMLHALTLLPNHLRGVAKPQADITDGELEILTKAGVVGTRYYFAHWPEIEDKVIRRVHEFGWAPHYFYETEAAMNAWRRQILASPGKFIIEHNGAATSDLSFDHPIWRFLFECLDTGRCWVKLTTYFSKERRNDPQMNPPFSDMTRAARKLAEYAPNRLLWGSDWPHGRWKPKPNDSAIIDAMLDWVPDEAVRNRIFVQNPGEAFGFPPIVKGA